MYEKNITDTNVYLHNNISNLFNEKYVKYRILAFEQVFYYYFIYNFLDAEDNKQYFLRNPFHIYFKNLTKKIKNKHDISTLICISNKIYFKLKKYENNKKKKKNKKFVEKNKKLRYFLKYEFDLSACMLTTLIISLLLIDFNDKITQFNIMKWSCVKLSGLNIYNLAEMKSESLLDYYLNIINRKDENKAILVKLHDINSKKYINWHDYFDSLDHSFIILISKSVSIYQSYFNHYTINKNLVSKDHHFLDYEKGLEFVKKVESINTARTWDEEIKNNYEFCFGIDTSTLRINYDNTEFLSQIHIIKDIDSIKISKIFNILNCCDIKYLQDCLSYRK